MQKKTQDCFLLVFFKLVIIGISLLLEQGRDEQGDIF